MCAKEENKLLNTLNSEKISISTISHRKFPGKNKTYRPKLNLKRKEKKVAYGKKRYEMR
jgi:hypothetical protein